MDVKEVVGNVTLHLVRLRPSCHGVGWVLARERPEEVDYWDAERGGWVTWPAGSRFTSEAEARRLFAERVDALRPPPAR